MGVSAEWCVAVEHRKSSSIRSKLKAVDSKLFLFPFYFYFLFKIIFLSILKTIIRVTRLCSHTSVTSDDIVTSHEM